jgi:predicted enzyme related to lactoylglutathione lyase
MSEESKVQAGSISWVDLTVENAESLRDFYSAVAGWQTTEVDMGGYSDYCMNEPATGKSVAGVCHARGGNTGLPAQWLIYITVENLDQSISKCVELGGQILSAPRGSIGQNRYCVIRDPAGAVAALFESAK